MRRIFVGDIQGCREPLEALLSATGFEAGVDRLYPVGDLVNKGPDSEGVLQLLRRLDALPVLGNHDVRWLENRSIEDPASEAWLRSQPFVRQFPDIIMVHAGLHPKWTEVDLASVASVDLTSVAHLTDARVRFATTVRYCDADGNQPPTDWPPPEPPFRPWHEFYTGSKRVVFGHWARQGLFRNDHVLGLDTGCCYGNELTAWIAEEDRIVQVPSSR